MGALETIAGADKDGPTCCTAAQEEGNRRDFVLASTTALPLVASLSIDKESTVPTHKPVMTELRTNTLKTAAKMKVPVPDLEEYMPRDEKGKLDIWRMRAAVDIAIMAREGDLERAKEQEDPTKLWQILSDAAEEGLVGLIEDEQLRRAAKGRGRHRVKHYSQVQTPAREEKIFQALPQEVLIPTELHATYVKAGRRLQNLEHLWRKGGTPEWYGVREHGQSGRRS